MIRKMLPKDFADIYKLGEVLNERYTSLYKLNDVINDNNQKVYVYDVNDNVVSFLHLTISFDEADIIDIITNKKYRNQGIGTALINHAIEENKLMKINLEVRESNVNAIKFYEQLNFKTIRKIKKYYNNEDAFFMVKEINK